MSIFSKKNRNFDFEGQKFEVKRISATVLFDALKIVTETGIFDLLVTSAAANKAKNEKERDAVLAEVGTGAVLALKDSIGDIEDRVKDIIGRIVLVVDDNGDKVALTQEDKDEMPIEFIIAALAEALKTVDAKSFLATFQNLAAQATTKIEVAQAPAAASPMA